MPAASFAGSPSDRDITAAHVLRLLDAPGLGPRRVLDLLLTYISVDGVIEFIRSGPKVPERVKAFVEMTPLDQYLQSIEDTYALGAGFVLWSDSSYPSNLGKWAGRPPVLFYRGDLRDLQDRSLALVGRVDPSPGGVDAAFRFGRMCVEADITVVSGLAKGIDGAAHRAALSPPSGVTYAVVGHGLDHSYPRENADLYKAIPEHGAVVSQFRTGVGPQRWTFPARNEVMCTLALGTVIVEGKRGCGSIIQADFSFKHDRPVFLLSRNLRSDDSGWAHELAERGAHVIETFDQVLDIVENTLGALWRRPEPVEETLFAADAVIPSVSTPRRASSNMTQEAAAAIFDLDGVVVDSREATAGALARIASRHTGTHIDPATISVSGAPHKILAGLGVRLAYDVYKDEYDDAFRGAADAVKVFDSVVDGMREMHKDGIRLAVVTAQPARRANAMVPPEVRELFDEFLTYNETRGRKEVGITAALQAMRVSRERAIYIGDQSTDLEAARKAGVRGVGVLWGFSSEEELHKWPHDLLLEEQSEISSDLVRSLLKY